MAERPPEGAALVKLDLSAHGGRGREPAVSLTEVACHVLADDTIGGLLATPVIQVTIARPAGPAPPELVDVAEVAAALGCTKWTIYRLASSRSIPVVRVGRKVRFELHAVIEALRVPARAEAPPGSPAGPGLVGRRRRATPVAQRRSARPLPASGGADREDHQTRLLAAIEATKPLGR